MTLSPSSSRRWVLIVDDDPDMLNLLTEFVHGPEMKVTTATDALSAFIQARDLRPALVISDMQMPGFYGAATLTELRKDPRTSMPFIFVTGMGLEKAQALVPPGTPGVRFLAKPVDWDKLERYVFELTGMKIGPDSNL